MTISFACPHCRRPFNLPDGLAGKRARCKTCDRIITVPQEESETRVLSEKGVVKPKEPTQAPPSSGFLEALDEPLPGLSEAMDDSQTLLLTSGRSSRNSTFYIRLAIGCVVVAVLMSASLMIMAFVSKRQTRSVPPPVTSSDSGLQVPSNSEDKEGQ